MMQQLRQSDLELAEAPHLSGGKTIRQLRDEVAKKRNLVQEKQMRIDDLQDDFKQVKDRFVDEKNKET